VQKAGQLADNRGMHWECLIWALITYCVGILVGAVFFCPRAHAADRPAEGGARGSNCSCWGDTVCTCGETFTYTCEPPTVNEKLRELLARKAPWEQE
jgi:hypothetical protein